MSTVVSEYMIITFVTFEKWIVMYHLWFWYRDKHELVNEWTFWLCNMTLVSQWTRIGSKITNPNYDQALLSQAPRTFWLCNISIFRSQELHHPLFHWWSFWWILIFIKISASLSQSIKRSYFASSSFSGLNVMVKSSNQIEWISYVSFWLECHG